jgi:hypothetical protein
MQIFCRGGVFEASSFVPDPVAMSSAESEYNAACAAAISIAHLRMLVQEVNGHKPDTPLLVPLLIDSRSAQAMGNSFRDTKRTRHFFGVIISSGHKSTLACKC